MKYTSTNHILLLAVYTGNINTWVWFRLEKVHNLAVASLNKLYKLFAYSDGGSVFQDVSFGRRYDWLWTFLISIKYWTKQKPVIVNSTNDQVRANLYDPVTDLKLNIITIVSNAHCAFIWTLDMVRRGVARAVAKGAIAPLIYRIYFSQRPLILDIL